RDMLAAASSARPSADFRCAAGEESMISQAVPTEAAERRSEIGIGRIRMANRVDVALVRRDSKAKLLCNAFVFLHHARQTGFPGSFWVRRRCLFHVGQHETHEAKDSGITGCDAEVTADQTGNVSGIH